MAAFALGAAWAAADSAAVPFDDDDFLIAGFTSGTIGVYDSDLSFKGDLDASFRFAAGLDFDAAGNLVATNQGNREGGTSEVRVYDSSGTQISNFINTDLVTPIDLKVGPAVLGGNYYVGTQSRLREFSPAGATLRQLSTASDQGVAVLPGEMLWGGGFRIAGIDVFDLATGTKTATLPFDNGQLAGTSMFYSAATDTVLIADPLANAVFERQTDGTFVRSFTATQFVSPFGVTRGPGGDVFATDGDGVYRWNANGRFVGFTDLSASIDNPVNIVWRGNIPEPTTAALTLVLSPLLLSRRKRGVS